MTTDRARAAQTVLEVPFFLELLDDLERAAVDACINAKYNDHEARQHHALAARAVRELRSQLVAISQEGQTTESRKVPA